MNVISSVSYDQSEIINNILLLHTDSHIIDCDPTYSKGNFYKHTGIKEPIYKFDINPQTDDTIQADVRDLPLENKSIPSFFGNYRKIS